MKKAITALAIMLCLLVASSAYCYTVTVTYKADVVIPECPAPVAYVPAYQPIYPVYQPAPVVYQQTNPAYNYAGYYRGYADYTGCYQSACPLAGIPNVVGEVLAEAGNMVGWTLKSLTAPFACQGYCPPQYGVPANYYQAAPPAPSYYYPVPAAPVIYGPAPTLKRRLLAPPTTRQIKQLRQQPPSPYVPQYGPTHQQPSTEQPVAPKQKKKIWGGSNY
jgi:hypothetical protein